MPQPARNFKEANPKNTLPCKYQKLTDLVQMLQVLIR